LKNITESAYDNIPQRSTKTFKNFSSDYGMIFIAAEGNGNKRQGEKCLWQEKSS